MTTLRNPEERMWRTDTKRGRSIYALLSNDVLKPSEDDPMIGTMDSSIMAEDVVNTHNGVLALYGRRYPQVLAAAEIEAPSKPKNEGYFKLGRTELNRSEHSQLLILASWLHKGPLESIPIVEKLYRALGGEDG